MVLMLWFCFVELLGFYRVSNDSLHGFRDGDLVVYEKLWRNYDQADTVIFDDDGIKVAEFAAMNGGIIKGRVLFVLETRGFCNE